MFIAVQIDAGGGTGEEILIVGKGGHAEKAENKAFPFLVSAGSWVNRGVKTQHPSSNGRSEVKVPNFRYALVVAHVKGFCAYLGYKALKPEQQKPAILYHVILDVKQTMALSTKKMRFRK